MEFFQEQRTDEAVKMLDKAMTQYCMVERDGKLKKMEIKYVVPGDLIYMTAGDKVAADGHLVRSPGLLVDESILTGESIPVEKTAVEGSQESEGVGRVSQGTLVVQGEGYLQVDATGANTTYGKLGTLLGKIEQSGTPLQKKIHRLVRLVAMVAIFLAIAVGFILTIKHGWAEGLLGGLTMAISLIPEEFPVVFSVFLIMGVWRMTKQKALVRDMVMVETLGSATVICTDKTGTLTEGKLTLKQIFANNKIINAEQIKNHQVEMLGFFQNTLLALEEVAIDPIEIEAQRFAKELGLIPEQFYKEHTLIKEIPFDSKTKLVIHLWQNNKDNNLTQCCAGAPEAVIKASNLSVSGKANAEKAFQDLSSEGQRVIAVGRKSIKSVAEFNQDGWNFVGLLAMSDPPRAGVKEAIATCQKAGIRIIMITGDNKLTAHSVAEQIGLKHNEQILSGVDLENLSPDALREAVKRHDIFARVFPEQKFQLVQALQEAGEIVAMTGDGVNDAPALKKANIGIAMGEKGTEVARAAAGMILLDDNFATIVNAVKEGRRIYDNLRQAFVFLFSFHLPIVGLAVLPLLLGHPLIFMPIHIIFLELICDPAAVLGFDREKARRGLLNEPPRPATEPLINPALWKKIIIQGIGFLGVSFAFYYYFAIIRGNEDLGRTLSFASLVISQIMLILFTREWEQVKTNFLLILIPALTMIFLFFAFYFSFLRRVFHFVQPSAKEIFFIIALPLAIAIIIKLGYTLRRRVTT
jgi:Ca2+-transporting ATPase